MADRYQTAAGIVRLSQCRRRRRGRLMAVITCAVASALLTLPTGCSTISNMGSALQNHDGLDQFMVGYRNRAWSAKAWHRHKHLHCNHKHLADFCNGFRQGYEDVAAGSDGCTPAVAPKEYWGWRYQSAEGQSKVGAWFSGYPLGAKAAEEDGIGNWSQLQTNFAVPAPIDPYCGTPGIVPIDGMPHPAVPLPGMLDGAVETVPVPVVPYDAGLHGGASKTKQPARNQGGSAPGSLDVQSEADIAELFGLDPTAR